MSRALRPGRAEDRADIRALWQLCFGDDDAYLDLFFSGCAAPEDFLLLTEDGLLRAMLCGLDAPIVSPDGAVHPAVYVYALGTHPASRGRGLCRALLDYAAEHYGRSGYEAIHLVPEKPSLFAFFGQLGLSPDLPLRVLRPDGAAAPAGEVTPLTPEAYLALREALLAGTAHVVPTLRQAAHQKTLSRLGGADLFALEIGGASACAAVEALDGAYVARELLLPAGLSAADAAALLAARFPGPWTLRLPVAAQAGTPVPFGMLRWLVPPAVAAPIHPAFAFD